jgi:hypothetical protein
MIVLNMLLFVFVAVGQAVIYTAIQSNTMHTGNDARKQQNANVARRLITIAVTDFACWFPVCLLGTLAVAGVSIPNGANVALVTFVIPLNSAINPILYTANTTLQQRRLAKEQRLLAQLKNKYARNCPQQISD